MPALTISTAVALIELGAVGITGLAAICTVIYNILKSERCKKMCNLMFEHIKALVYYKEKSLGVSILNKIRDFFMKLFHIKPPV